MAHPQDVGSGVKQTNARQLDATKTKQTRFERRLTDVTKTVAALQYALSDIQIAVGVLDTERRRKVYADLKG